MSAKNEEVKIQLPTEQEVEKAFKSGVHHMHKSGIEIAAKIAKMTEEIEDFVEEEIKEFVKELN